MTTRITFSEIPKGLMSSMIATEGYLNKLSFDYKLLELIRVRVSNINQCAYCIDMHIKEALAAGEDLQRLYSVNDWQDTNYYSDLERACLAWAECITQPNSAQYDQQSLFENLLHFYDKPSIANLSFVIIQINAWNRLMKSCGIEPGSYQVGQH
ncbi:MAG: carboxymuconolactone decarboxylase family protein [Oceanospirillaceae bacterium]|nr:carboxymuconolactone decarboxylase family protein [Oceanospirillaceae bacterium]